MAKVSKQIHQLFLRLLNLSPELVDRIQKEANLQDISFDAFIRAAVDKHLKDMTVTRDQQEPDRLEARLRLRAHFAEDRNECLTEQDIRIIGG